MEDLFFPAETEEEIPSSSARVYLETVQEKGERLDVFCTRMTGETRAFIQKLILLYIIPLLKIICNNITLGKRCYLILIYRLNNTCSLNNIGYIASGNGCGDKLLRHSIVLSEKEIINARCRYGKNQYNRNNSFYQTFFVYF